jgi:hypothetical protein
MRSQTANVLTFVPPAGVGAGKQLFVRVLDRAAPAIVADPIANLLASPNLQLVQDPRDPRLLPNFCCGGNGVPSLPYALNSAPVIFSYAAPQLISVSPSTVRAGSVRDPSNFPVVTVRGYNLGNAASMVADMWLESDRAINVSVGAAASSTQLAPVFVPCLAVSRQVLVNPAGAENVLLCTVDTGKVGAGAQPIVVSVAGQSSPPFESTLLDVTVTCDTAFFAKACEAGSAQSKARPRSFCSHHLRSAPLPYPSPMQCRPCSRLGPRRREPQHGGVHGLPRRRRLLRGRPLLSAPPARFLQPELERQGQCRNQQLVPRRAAPLVPSLGLGRSARLPLARLGAPRRRQRDLLERRARLY